MALRACAMCAALVSCCALGSARAEEVDAEAQFTYGVSEMMAGRYATGCPALESSYHLDPRPGSLFTLAECDLKWGRTASALTNYEQFLALYSRMSPAQKAKQGERARLASEERASLALLVPHVTVRMPDGSPSGIVVHRDDVEISGPMLGVAVPVDPGEHIVRVTLPDGRTSEQRLTLTDGESRVVFAQSEIVAPAQSVVRVVPPPEPAYPRTEPTQTVSHRTWTLVAVSGGVAGLAVAAVTGGLALSKKATASSDCTGNVCLSLEGANAGNAARGLADAETVAWVVGGACLVTALVLWVTDPKSTRPANSGWVSGISNGFRTSW